MLDEGVEGVPGERNADVFGRICDALMFVTAAGGGKGGLDGVERLEGGDGGKSRAAAKHDMTNPSVESEAVVVVTAVLLLVLLVLTLLLLVLLPVVLEVVVVVVVDVDVVVDVEVKVSVSDGKGGSGLLEGRAGVGGIGGVALLLLCPFVGICTLLLAPLASLLVSSFVTEPLDLVDNCLINVPDSRGSVN